MKKEELIALLDTLPEGAEVMVEQSNDILGNFYFISPLLTEDQGFYEKENDTLLHANFSNSYMGSKTEMRSKKIWVLR